MADDARTRRGAGGGASGAEPRVRRRDADRRTPRERDTDTGAAARERGEDAEVAARERGSDVRAVARERGADTGAAARERGGDADVAARERGSDVRVAARERGADARAAARERGASARVAAREQGAETRAETLERDADARERDADARALASTLRLRILRLCLDESLTNRELAERLDRNPATTLHHVRTLVDRGFLAAEPVRRGARGSREVPYRATGRSWGSRQPHAFSRVLIDTFLEEVAQADPDTVGTTRLGVRLDAAGKAELDRRVQELFDELAARPPAPGGTPYSIFYAIHEDAGRLPQTDGRLGRAHGTD